MLQVFVQVYFWYTETWMRLYRSEIIDVTPLIYCFLLHHMTSEDLGHGWFLYDILQISVSCWQTHRFMMLIRGQRKEIRNLPNPPSYSLTVCISKDEAIYMWDRVSEWEHPISLYAFIILLKDITVTRMNLYSFKQSPKHSSTHARSLALSLSPCLALSICVSLDPPHTHRDKGCFSSSPLTLCLHLQTWYDWKVLWRRSATSCLLFILYFTCTDGWTLHLSYVNRVIALSCILWLFMRIS